MEGQVISHYRLVRKLGSGAFGEVWEGVHTDFEEMRVAIKLFHMELARDAGFVQRLKEECLRLHTWQHPNIVGFRELVLSGERPAMVMELVEGEDAFEAVQRGALSPERVLEVGRDALTGLSFAHEAGVIHRDIKPSNLYLCRNGKTKLLDFGIAKAADGSNATKTGTIQGTLQYIAPEQFSGSKANTSSDLYALGLSLAELLTGRPACPVGAMPEQFAWHLTKGLESMDRGGIPPALWTVLLKLASKDESARYGSAAEALSAWNGIELSPEAVSSVGSPVTPPSTVTLDLAEASKMVGEGSERSLPPDSVVLNPSEVEKAVVPERKSSGCGKGLVFGCLGVLVLVGGCFVLGVESFDVSPGRKLSSESVSISGVSFDTVTISGGSFVMGCLWTDWRCWGKEGQISYEKPRHKVTISDDLIVMSTEVTQGLYESVMGQNPSRFSSCGSDCPVENVSWYDAVGFANRLSAEMGLSQCYEINGEEVSWSNVECSGWRLPTEAEWEYLSHGGEEHLYSGSNRIDDVAWYSGNSGREPHPVGQKQANGFGLYDMSGNVLEWCWDWFGDYSSGLVTDPRGPSSGSSRVERGGCYAFNARYARASGRDYGDPSDRYSTLGVRFLRTKN